MCEPEDPKTVFKLEKVIGHGNFGTVWKAKQITTENLVAVKIFHVIENDSRQLESLKKEISFLKSCNHEYIVKFLGSFYCRPELWISMEFCETSIHSLMKKMKTGLAEQQIRVIMKHALRALSYLHFNKKIHRDIKADNILLTRDGKAKLADLGVAAQLSGTLDKRHTTTGSPYWMAPEMLTESVYNNSVDIWALGITAIECAEMRPPLFDYIPCRAMYLIGDKNTPPPTLSKPDNFSENLNSFVNSCLIRNPEQRWTAKELLDHPFIKGSLGEDCLKELVDDFLFYEERKQKEREEAAVRDANICRLIAKINEDAKENFSFENETASTDSIDSIPSEHPDVFYPICVICSEQQSVDPWGMTKKPPLTLNSSIIDRVDDLVDVLRDPDHGVAIVEHKKRPGCFSGTALKAWLVENLSLQEDEAMAIEQTLIHRGIIQALSQTGPFSSEKEVYFYFKDRKIANEKSTFISSERIEQLSALIHWGIKKNEKKCFQGAQLVDWLMEYNELTDRDSAVKVGQLLMDRSFIYAPHSNSQRFTDSDTMYKFLLDDKKAKSVSVRAKYQSLRKINRITWLSSSRGSADGVETKVVSDKM